MYDYLLSFFHFFQQDNAQLILMFTSSFLSATILPGNSEIVFATLANTHILDRHFLAILFAIATIGNTLGSLTTYLIAKAIPPIKFTKQPNKLTQRSIQFTQRYGIWVLLFSWLPVIGDIFCGVAGWLRLNFYWSLFFIMLGKATRYLVILWGIYTVLS